MELASRRVSSKISMPSSRTACSKSWPRSVIFKSALQGTIQPAPISNIARMSPRVERTRDGVAAQEFQSHPETRLADINVQMTAHSRSVSVKNVSLVGCIRESWTTNKLGKLSDEIRH